MFSVLMGFLAIRLYLYVDIKILHYIFKNNPDVYTTIPFYITEIIIAGSLSYVLYMTAQMERDSQNQNQADLLNSQV